MNIQNEFEKFAIHHQGINSNALHQYKKLFPQALTPYIIEERPLNMAQMDVFSRLMMDRIIFLGQPLDDYVCNVIIAQLLFLDSVDRTRDIQMYINCPGGSVYSGLGLYDTMQYVSPNLTTICVGMAASMASVVLCAGTQGKRTALKHSRIMLHQPSGGIGGQASDIEIMANEIAKMKQELYDIIAFHTKQPIQKIASDCDRDFWMTASQAKEYGIVDEVLISNPKKNN